MKYVDVDRIYQKVPLDKIPWNSETPPDAHSRIPGIRGLTHKEPVRYKSDPVP